MTELKTRKISNTSTYMHRKKDTLAPPLPSSPPPRLNSQKSFERVCKVECPFASDQHQGKELLRLILPVAPKTLFSKIFEDENFLSKIYAGRNYEDYPNVEWKKSINGKESTRSLNFVANLPTKALGPSIAQVSETQTLSEATRDDELYIVNSVTTNGGIPYADNFRIHVHYCITRDDPRAPDASQCQLSIFGEVKFLKTTFFLVKGMIEKNSYEGLQNLFDDVASALKAEMGTLDGPAPPNSPKKRKRDRTPADTTKSRRNGAGKGEKGGGGKFRTWSIVCVLTLLVGIGVMNGYLFFKMNKLHNIAHERQHAQNQHQSESSNIKPDEEILKDLKQQEAILRRHFAEWKERFEHIFNALNTSLSSLQEIVDLLPSYEAELLAHLFKFEEGREGKEGGGEGGGGEGAGEENKSLSVSVA